MLAIIMTGALMPSSAPAAKAEPESADAPGSAMRTPASDVLAPSTTEATFAEPEDAPLEPGVEEPAIEEPDVEEPAIEEPGAEEPAIEDAASTPPVPDDPPRDGPPLDTEAPPPTARGATTYRWAGRGELERRRNAFAITWGVGTAGMLAGIALTAYGVQACGLFPATECSRGQKAAGHVGVGLGLIGTAAAVTGLVGFFVSSAQHKRQSPPRVSTNLGGLTVRF